MPTVRTLFWPCQGLSTLRAPAVGAGLACLPASPAPARAPTVGAPGAHTSSRGLVLWLTLVAMLFFVALTMYVFNLGRHVERQETTQDSADAAAIGAAGQAARVFNQVAHHNLEMTRLIVAAQLLDALPQAAAYTRADQEAMLASLEALPNPASGPYPQLAALAAQGKARTLADVQAQVHALAPVVDRFFANYGSCAPDALNHLTLGGSDIRESTWYQTPSGAKGGLWKAVDALDKISAASLAQLGLSAQAAATSSAVQVQGDGPHHVAGAIPFRIDVPCQRGAFDDFYRPIIHGEIPAASGGTDPLLHRGPFDSVMGWLTAIRAPGTSTPGTAPTGPSAPSDGSPFGGSNPGGTPGTFTPGPIIGYRPQGYFAHEISTFCATVGGPFWGSSGIAMGGQWGALPQQIGVNSQLTRRVGQLALRKLMMARQATPPWNGAYADLTGDLAPPTLRVPRWLFPMSTARARARAGANNPSDPINGPNAYAMWIRIEDPQTSPHASWDLMPITQHQRFFRQNNQPPMDMFFDAPETAFRVKLGEGIYVAFTPVPITDPQTGAVIGTTPLHPVLYLWAGVNAPTVELRESPDNTPSADLSRWVNIDNPNPGAAAADLPAPTDLKPEYARPPTAMVPGQWCVLGFAANPNTAPAWSTRFHSAPHARHSALAQAHVFNNHSWDLWTPMWHAQLCPINGYDTWLSTLQATAQQAGAGDGVNRAELPGLIRYLEAIKPMAPLLTH